MVLRVSNNDVPRSWIRIQLTLLIGRDQLG